VGRWRQELCCVSTRLRSESRTDKIERLLGKPHGTVSPRCEAIVSPHREGDGHSGGEYGIGMWLSPKAGWCRYQAF
jgi:hypothetical protein